MASEESQFVARAERLAGPAGVVGFRAAAAREAAFAPQNRYVLPQFEEKGAVVLGISKDSVESHKRFEEKHGLKFTLLSDENLETIKAYDVWKEKKSFGKTYMGVVRTTYLIDEDGMIVKSNDKVKAAEDAEKMMEEF